MVRFRWLYPFKTNLIVILLVISLCLFSSNLLLNTIHSPLSSSTDYDFLNSSEDWLFNRFLINNSDRCISMSNPSSFLLLVHSNPDNKVNRDLFRVHTPSSYRLVFLLGSRDTGNQRIISESNEHGDIVQGDFIDSYRNLTIKHIMGLTWAALYCPTVPFVMKVDDDILLNYTFIENYLNSEFPASTLDPFLPRTPVKIIAGYVMPQSPPIRDPSSKWYVSSSEFPNSFYPTFVSGWAYITTVNVIHELLNKIKSTPIFWIDDIYVTGMLRSQVDDIFFYSINKFVNIDLTILTNWTQTVKPHVWPYMVSVTSNETFKAALERYQFCSRNPCYCCLSWLNPFKKTNSDNSDPGFIPLSLKGQVNELSIG